LGSKTFTAFQGGYIVNEAKPQYPWGFLETLSEITQPSSQGRKDDQNKIQPELIAPEIITALASVLAYGAKKYSPRNWEKGMAWSRPYGALMRHMWAWWSCADKDEETKMSHLWHAACCIMFLIAYDSRGVGTDDRWRKET
jgi:hypothetical protein